MTNDVGGVSLFGEESDIVVVEGNKVTPHFPGKRVGSWLVQTHVFRRVDFVTNTANVEQPTNERARRILHRAALLRQW